MATRERISRPRLPAFEADERVCAVFVEAMHPVGDGLLGEEKAPSRSAMVHPRAARRTRFASREIGA
jgi:hypothetical protein